MHWMKLWCFNRNPFDTTPVKRKNIDMYIDRDEVKKIISAIIGYERGKYVVIGDTGVGKSSTLNYIQNAFLKSNEIIVTFTAQKADEDEKIYDKILNQLKSKVSPHLSSSVQKKWDSLDIIEKEKVKALSAEDKKEGGVGVGIKSFKAKGLWGRKKGKTASMTIKAREHPQIKKHDHIIELGRAIVKEGRKKIVFIVDDLDKLNTKDAIQFLVTLQELIRHFDCFLFTTLKRKIGSPLRQHLSDSHYITIPVKNVAEFDMAKKFIMERICVCTETGKKPMWLFHREALRKITQRANGNLRELFNYCANTMEQWGGAKNSH